MKKPLRKSSTIQRKTILLQLSLAGILSMMGAISLLEPGSSAGSATTRGKEVAAIRHHMSEVLSALGAYLEHHRAPSLERVKAEGEEASRRVNELATRLTVEGDGDLSKRLGEAHRGLREACSKLITADQETVKTRQDVQEASDEIKSSLSRGLRAERNALRARTLIEKYEDLLSALEQAETNKNAAMDRIMVWREAQEKVLREVPGVVSTGGSSPIYLFLKAFVFLGGMFLIFRINQRLKREITRPVKDILECVNAAATGDTSRIPDRWTNDEIGLLSQAVGRLIGVLSRSENLVYHLAALVESSGDAIISHTLDGKILSWNKGAQRIYGYSAEEVKGKCIDMLTWGMCRAEMMNTLERVRKGERIQPFESVHVARNGRHIKAFVRVAAIYDSTRTIIGASFIAQDLTDARGVSSHPASSKAAA